jgi:hypothetical protein
MRVLPARLARLARGLAIIFVREFFLSAAATPSTAIAATVSATTTAPAARTARTAGFGLRPRLIDLQVSSAKILAIEGGDGFGGFIIILHFDETEAASASGFAVGGDVDASELSERLEERAKIRSRGLKAHIAYKQVLHTGSLLNVPWALRKDDTQVSGRIRNAPRV